MAGRWDRLANLPTTAANQPAFDADTMLLLTDGTVMCHQANSANWFKLTPNSTGSYINGTWGPLKSLPNTNVIPNNFGGPTNAPLYFVSAVLASGKVFTAGGEYNAGILNADTLAAQVYDPVADSWTTVPSPPGWTGIGDSPSCVLPDGRVLVGSYNSRSVAIFNPATLTWVAAANKGDSSSEETFTLLPDGTILTVQCSNAPNAEKYLIASDRWVSASQTPAILPQACPNLTAEIGPAILLPDGRVFAIGSTGNTALYTPPAVPSAPGTWAPGPTLTDGNANTSFPMDAPAVLLPNGRVLCVGSPGPPCSFPGPTTFFEFDPATYHPLSPGAPITVFQQQPGVWAGLTVDKGGAMNVVWADFNLNDGWKGPVAFGDPHLSSGAPITVFQQQSGVWAGLTVDQGGAMNVVWADFNLNDGWKGPIPFGGLTVIASPSNAGGPCYQGRFLLLPTGQVLFSTQRTTIAPNQTIQATQISVYTPDGSPDAAWRPSIIQCPGTLFTGQSFKIVGTQLNGLSQAVSYGDDAQMATNYPLVRIASVDGPNVLYLPTSNHSTMAVATGDSQQATSVFVPPGTPAGKFALVIVANGIASQPVTITVRDG